MNEYAVRYTKEPTVT